MQMSFDSECSRTGLGGCTSNHCPGVSDISVLHFEKPWAGIPEVKVAEESSSQYVRWGFQTGPRMGPSLSPHFPWMERAHFRWLLSMFVTHPLLGMASFDTLWLPLKIKLSSLLFSCFCFNYNIIATQHPSLPQHGHLYAWDHCNCVLLMTT